jgi:hypothetical protein
MNRAQIIGIISLVLAVVVSLTALTLSLLDIFTPEAVFDGKSGGILRSTSQEQELYLLQGDGRWVSPASLSIQSSTGSLMVSSDDVIELKSIKNRILLQTGDNNYWAKVSHAKLSHEKPSLSKSRNATLPTDMSLNCATQLNFNAIHIAMSTTSGITIDTMSPQGFLENTRILYLGSGSLGDVLSIQDDDTLMFVPRLTLRDMDDRIVLQKDKPNGIASLDGNLKIPDLYLPATVLSGFLGKWDATSNNPTLISGIGENTGDYYVVSLSGNVVIDGLGDWAFGDLITYNGIVWEKTPNTNSDLDTHLADLSKHRTINDSGFSTTDLWSASKIYNSLADKSETTHMHISTDITDLAAFVEDAVNLNSQVLANSNKVSADGSVSTHSDVNITALMDKELLSWDTATSRWINQTLAEIGGTSGGGTVAAHQHDASDITIRQFYHISRQRAAARI